MPSIVVRYQIVFNQIVSIKELKEKLIDDFLKFVSSFEEFTKAELKEMFEITYFSQLNENKLIIGLSYSDKENVYNEKITQLLLEQFNKFLNLNEDIEISFKYQDGLILKKLKGFYEEIFAIEMLLREFYSLLLLKHYKRGISNLLENTNIQCKHSFKAKNKSEILKNRLENDLFYIDYNKGYQKLKDIKIKNISIGELRQLIQNCKDGKEKLGMLSNMEFIDLSKNEKILNEISSKLPKINNIRKKIAHMRDIILSDDETPEYNKAKSEINGIIINYFDQISMSSCPECGGIVETREVVTNQTSEGEPLQIKYTIRCKSCGQVFNEELIDI